MTHEDFVTYSQAKALKELGFNWPCKEGWVLNDEKKWVYQPCPAYWHFLYNCEDKTISAPTLAQAQKWLREVKSIFIQSSLIRQQSYDKKHDWLIYDKDGKCIAYSDCSYDSYEQALLAGIDKVLEFLKEENNGK